MFLATPAMAEAMHLSQQSSRPSRISRCSSRARRLVAREDEELERIVGQEAGSITVDTSDGRVVLRGHRALLGRALSRAEGRLFGTGRREGDGIGLSRTSRTGLTQGHWLL